MPDETVKDDAPKEPMPPQPVRCRCKGLRAILVFGSDQDPTIKAALTWTLAQQNVQLKTHFLRAPADLPKIPNATETGWQNLRVPGGGLGKSADLGKSVSAGCFFEEILVMAHGRHGGLKGYLSGKLGQVLQTRPVRKLSIWTCDTATDVYPGNFNNRKYYERICGLVHPKACPCNCDLTRCRGRCHTPDGGIAPGYRCPSTADPTLIYMAAWEDIQVKGKRHHIAAKLGLSPGAANNQVLTSPDGRLRQITVTSDGVARMRLVTGADVFAGIRVRRDPALSPAKPARAPRLDATRRADASKTLLPKALHGYSGPDAAGRHAREGCLKLP